MGANCEAEGTLSLLFSRRLVQSAQDETWSEMETAIRQLSENDASVLRPGKQDNNIFLDVCDARFVIGDSGSCAFSNCRFVCFQPLRRALARVGVQNLVPDQLDNCLSYSVVSYLKKLKNQVGEYETNLLGAVSLFDQEEFFVLEPPFMTGSFRQRLSMNGW